MTRPQPLSRRRYRKLAKQIEEHHRWVNAASCKPGIGSPYSNRGDIECVSITAIIEHFGPEQQAALVKYVNENYLQEADSWLMNRLQAEPLDRAERGIQFTYNNPQENHFFVDDLKAAAWRGECLSVSDYLGDTTKYNFENFFNQCQIRFAHDEPFGNTTARKVDLVARSSVPLRIMVDLLRTLWLPHDKRAALGFGSVEVVKTSGLPQFPHDNYYFINMNSYWM